MAQRITHHCDQCGGPVGAADKATGFFMGHLGALLGMAPWHLCSNACASAFLRACADRVDAHPRELGPPPPPPPSPEPLGNRIARLAAETGTDPKDYVAAVNQIRVQRPDLSDDELVEMLKSVVP